MDNERVKAISSWLETSFTGSTGSAGIQLYQDIAYLLDENARLSSLADEYRSERDAARRVVEAARVYVASPEAGHTYLAVTLERFAALRDALATYDAGE